MWLSKACGKSLLLDGYNSNQSEPATSYCRLVGAGWIWWKLELRKGVYFVVWCGISFLPLLWATFFGGMAHAQLLSLPNAYLLSLMHTEQLARMKAFHPEAKHLWGAKLDKENLVLRSCCPFDSALFVLICGWRKWCNYFFIPSSWTGKTTEWLCKPLNYETKFSWQQSALRNCSLAPLSPGSPLFSFWIRTDWAGATVFQCSDPERLLVLVHAFQETNPCAW